MFRKFSLEEDVVSQTAIKSSNIRAIKQTICEQFPAIEEYMEDIIPKKAEVLEGKCRDRSTFVVVDGIPLFFKARDGPFFPTLRLLHRYPTMVPRVQVDTGAIKFVLSGANVMAPGLLSAGGDMPVDLPEGAPVAVYAQDRPSAMAVGTMTMSTEDVRKTRKGIAIEVVHYLSDGLWTVPSFK